MVRPNNIDLRCNLICHWCCLVCLLWRFLFQSEEIQTCIYLCLIVTAINMMSLLVVTRLNLRSFVCNIINNSFCSLVSFKSWVDSMGSVKILKCFSKTLKILEYCCTIKIEVRIAFNLISFRLCICFESLLELFYVFSLDICEVIGHVSISKNVCITIILLLKELQKYVSSSLWGIPKNKMKHLSIGKLLKLLNESTYTKTRSLWDRVLLLC